MPSRSLYVLMCLGEHACMHVCRSQVTIKGLLQLLSLFIYFEAEACYVVLACLELIIDQAGLELRDLSVSAFQVLGLQVCTTMWVLGI